jgi:hypothetical protein
MGKLAAAQRKAIAAAVMRSCRTMLTRAAAALK